MTNHLLAPLLQRGKTPKTWQTVRPRSRREEGQVLALRWDSRSDATTAEMLVTFWSVGPPRNYNQHEQESYTPAPSPFQCSEPSKVEFRNEPRTDGRAFLVVESGAKPKSDGNIERGVGGGGFPDLC